MFYLLCFLFLLSSPIKTLLLLGFKVIRFQISKTPSFIVDNYSLQWPQDFYGDLSIRRGGEEGKGCSSRFIKAMIQYSGHRSLFKKFSAERLSFLWLQQAFTEAPRWARNMCCVFYYFLIQVFLESKTFLPLLKITFRELKVFSLSLQRFSLPVHTIAKQSSVSEDSW